jgi:hypothetical protein
MEILIVVGIVAAIAAIIWFAYVQRKKRREALQTFARQYQMEYAQHDPFNIPRSYDFTLFRLGEGRGCENVVWGRWQGIPVREADYWYYTESTDSEGRTSRTYHHFSVVIADLDAVLPKITIERENLFTRLADGLGFHDISFESEDFNRRFQVKAKDQQFAFQVVDARMIHWLMANAEGYKFELAGRNLLVATKRRKPTELVPLFGTMKAFHDQIPRMVWNQYGIRQGPAATPGQPAAPAQPAVPAQPPAAAPPPPAPGSSAGQPPTGP